MNLRRAGATVLACAAVAFLGGCGPAGSLDAAATDVPAAFAIDQDFPDPDVLLVGDTYYAYATNSLTANVQFATSTDLRSWEVQDGDVLPDLPDWADTGRTWAPEVTSGPDGTFLLYFTAADRASGLQCIGVASAASATGPFVATSTLPLICPTGEGGAIDAGAFVDADGSRWLLWKNDGNCCSLDTWLQLSPLSPDGRTLTGEPTRLIKQSEDWHGTAVEAPILIRHDDEYVLFYSANSYADDSYAMGFATAPTLQGPYTNGAEPLFSTESSGDRYLGPGGQDVVSPGPGQPGGDRIVVHSWDPAYVYRGMSVLQLDWVDGRPTVVPPA
ncbi:arabinan endo-1,5-alpha-L-arabinosidase [Cryobacterium sp. MP_3.1]|uniref:glycoside hydrolase family 43 protein n=1 Tax=Cryobacterium sp. MP_3.1 TaxID=3071711 RepID=UPI002E0B6D9D|nr:arabinan endo-1,5-alpha-L-arabinosidase [Cryobacterium sp. MP_3.1]